MGCTPNKNEKQAENGNQDHKEQSPQLPHIQNIKYNPNNENVLGTNTQLHSHQQNLQSSYPSKETHSERSQIGGSLRPPLENKLSDFITSQNKTKYSMTVSQKKWMNLQEIFSYSQQKQRRYWQWYLTDYEADFQIRKSQIDNPYAQLSPSQVLKMLSPQAVLKIQAALKSEPAKKQQIAFEKIIQEVNDFPKLNLRKEQLNLSGLKEEKKEKEEIYVMRDDDDNAFKQTFSVQIYENSEMSQVQQQIAIED